MASRVQVRVHQGVQYVWYYCPGCKHNHGVPSERWHWDGNEESPSLSPSVRHFIPDGAHGPEQTLCHYNMRNGRMEYCSDCQHEYRGQAIDMGEPGPGVPDNS